MKLKEIVINARNCIDSSQDKDYRRALVNAALKFRASYAMELVNGSMMNCAESEIKLWVLALRHYGNRVWKARYFDK